MHSTHPTRRQRPATWGSAVTVARYAIASLHQARGALITLEQAAAEFLTDQRAEEQLAIDAVPTGLEVTARLPNGSPATIRIDSDEDGRLRWTASTLLPMAEPDARAQLDVHTVFRLIGETIAWYLHPVDKDEPERSDD